MHHFLSHAWPDGEGPASDLSKKGWMLYLQVMMTPILMLGGFLIGAELVYIMGWWVDNTLFKTLGDAYNASTGVSTGVFSIIGMLIVYTGLMFAIVWKSFDMVAELKNWVFEWIGGTPRSMGENQGQQQHLMAVANSAKQTGSSAVSTGVQSSARKGQSNAGAPKADAKSESENAGGGQPQKDSNTGDKQ